MQEITGSDRRVQNIVYPEELPISQSRSEIARTIRDHQVVIIAGETGSGKTTQLPKICLEMGRGSEQLIGHTQPRRLAARTVAGRIAQELGTELGDLVGYQVRFTDRVSANTAIKLMTDGILLAEMQRDPMLRRYDTLIIDEAHERSLNIDFLLGYLKRILPKRPDLKLIVTSATIDVDGFSKHFNDAPIIEVSGRSYPVETHYLEPDQGAEAGVEAQIVSLVEGIDGGQFGPRGDVLVFLPGERDIRELAKTLRQQTEVEILPLYARLSQAEQNRVFEGVRQRSGIRVILATNVAETSLTVPGIRYVIDPGEARISRYSHRTKLQRLPIEPVSRASADQRQGRCGRVGPGVCLRLYSEADYLGRPEFTDPEIQRTNLAAVVLQMLTLGLGEVEQFPFIDPPDSRMVRDGYKLLEELGAVSAAGKLTDVGKRMAQLPVDPRVARMVLASAEEGCLDDILVIASALTVPDPRERPAEKQQQADQMHARFRHPRSDFMAWLNLWRYYEEQRQALSQSKLRKLCRREFLSFLRMREWRDMHTQLTIACRKQMGSIRSAPRADNAEPDPERYREIHTALLSGLLSNIAQHAEGRDYLGSRNRKLQIFPGSFQARKSPKWLVAAEIVETSRVFAREVGAIDPGWALDINPHLLKHHYYSPRWQARRGQVLAYERISLYGLTLIDKRVVHYGPLAPAESRELMIREGLVTGNYRQPPQFLTHNLKLVQELQELESRTRRRDILVEEQALFDFYQERLPAHIVTAISLRNWLKRNPEAGRALNMTRELLLARDPGAVVGEQFPDELKFEDLRFELSYHFEPGSEADGVSVTIPVALLNRTPRYRFDWLVPGLLREKCIQLTKGLPKEKRKHLVPVPDYVDRALELLPADNSDLLVGLAERLGTLGGITLRSDDWSPQKLDDYYRMNIRVVDARGELLAQGRDLGVLVERFRTDTRQSISANRESSPARAGLTRWDLGDLAREWRFRQADMEIVAYPALVDKRDSVAIELCDYPSEAWLRHRLGVLRLMRLGAAQQVKYLSRQLLRGNEFNLVLAGAQLERSSLVDDLIHAAFSQAMALGVELPYTEDAYYALIEQGKGRVVGLANDIEATLLNAVRLLAEIRRKLAALEPGKWSDTRADIMEQLQGLLENDFQRDTPADWLAQYPRYMKALLQRIERLAGQYAKDQTNTRSLQALLQPLQALRAVRPGLLLLSEEARTYRWMVEEFRVSLFAQNLGTRQAVSQKRLQEQWHRVSEWVDRNPH
ncbi:MAG: ATP-dependent RNA helicase HrpA [Halioglobus sp.]|nr:ATP-dependent RNA helicase HrpA [Halioglobus sp.]